MRRVDVEKKRAARWPWLLGVVVLGLLVWGITVLLAPPEEPEQPQVADAARAPITPSAVPHPPDRGVRSALPALGELAPLDADDVGRSTRAAGEVVATVDGGFWLSTGREVVRVESRHPARQGDSVSVTGTLRDGAGAEGAGVPRVVERHAERSGGTVVSALRLVDETAVPSPPPDSSA